MRCNLYRVLALSRREDLQLPPPRSYIKPLLVQKTSVEFLALLGHASFLVLAPLLAGLLLVLGQEGLLFRRLLLVALLLEPAHAVILVEFCQRQQRLCLCLGVHEPGKVQVGCLVQKNFLGVPKKLPGS